MLILQRVVVAGILIKQRKVFLLQRSKEELVYPGLWELPSGKKEVGETCNEALMREYYEETGLKIIPDEVVSVFDYKLRKKDKIYETTQINYLIKLKKSYLKPHLGKEHQAYGLFTNNQLKKIYISKETRKVINQAYKKIQKR